MEDLGTIISRGWGTWKRNVSISIPVILQQTFSILLLIVVLGLVLIDTVPSSVLSYEGMLGFMLSKDFIFDMSYVFLKGFALYLLISTPVNSMFIASTVGMAKIALEKGHVGIQNMLKQGKKYYAPILASNIIINALSFMGAIFLYPGLSAGDFTSGAILLILGLTLWGLLILVFSILFSMVRYSIVILDLNVLEAFRDGVAFFRKYFLEVIVIWILVILVTTAVNVTTFIMGTSQEMFIVLYILQFTVLIAIMSLTVIWLSRLYMNRKGIVMSDSA